MAALAPLLVFFAFIGQNRNPDSVTASANGLGSLVNPLTTAGRLVDLHLTDGHGRTLLSEALTLVPRPLWPGKPDQFGRVIALRLFPTAQNTRLTVPCMPQGEWYYNFGWLGLIPMLVLLGYVIRKLDQTIARRSASQLRDNTAVYVFVTLAILVGSMSDLAWGGTPTWVNRNLQRLVVLVPVLLISFLVASRRRRREAEAEALAEQSAAVAARAAGRPAKTH